MIEQVMKFSRFFCAMTLGMISLVSVVHADAPIDLIVEGDYVVTMDADGRVIAKGAVAVHDGQIIDLGTAVDINARYQSVSRLAGDNRVVMPGLINGHAHSAMTLLRGIADDLSLYAWLNEYIFPAEVRFVDAEFVRIGMQLACWEMIRGGTTTFVDMYYFPDVIAEVVQDCGMRALVSATVIGQKSPDAESADDSLAKAVQFVQRWQNKTTRITPIFGPHANYTLNADQLKATREAAQKLDAVISIHMAESPFEVQYAKDTYGSGSVSMFSSIDFFAGPTIAAHMVWPSDAEIQLLADAKVGVVHNPTSNMKTAAGIAPVPELRKAGVPVGIGTDGAASNNDLDMWEEMRLAALLQKVHSMNPEVLPAREVLQMATIEGATAIGLADTIGSLEAGKQADLIQVDFSDAHHIPTYDVISHLVYVTDEQDVVTVLVDGELLMKDGMLLTLDTEKIAREASALAAKIGKSLSLGDESLSVGDESLSVGDESLSLGDESLRQDSE